MIIKSTKAIVNTDTYDSFYIDYQYSYRLLAVNRYTSDTVLIQSSAHKEVVEKSLDTIFNYVEAIDSQSGLDLGV